MSHHRALWVLQWLLGLYFIAVGVLHLIVPEGLPEVMSWMYDLSDAQHAAAGVAEILGGLGLLVPGLTGIRPELTAFAALGLIVVMVLAVFWHAGREEFFPLNLVLILVLGYVAYGRWKLAPVRRGTT